MAPEQIIFLTIDLRPEHFIFFGIFILCGSVHEFGHAWSAYRLGDTTAREMGRLTINPLAHIDLIGLVFPIILLLNGLPPIGWMKPVPVNTYNLRRTVRDSFIVSMAGPFSNILLAFLGLAVWEVLTLFGLASAEAIQEAISMWILINLALALFNLLPIPPLDGSSVVDFIRKDPHGSYHRQGFVGMIILYALLLYFNGFRYIFKVSGAIAITMDQLPIIAIAIFIVLGSITLIFKYRTSPKYKPASRPNPKTKDSEFVYEKARDIGLKLARRGNLSSSEAKWVATAQKSKGDGKALCSPISFHGDNEFCATCPNLLRCASRLITELKEGRSPS